MIKRLTLKTAKILLPALVMFFFSCTSKDQKQPADLLVLHANIYTMEDDNPQATAIAVIDGRIVYVGDDEGVEEYRGEETETIDLAGATLTPGFIEGHGHFMGTGMKELELDLSKTQSYDELVEQVAEKVKETAPGEWITGRGWHQDKWTDRPDTLVKGFQVHDKLSAVSPDNPVYLRHASGHAGFANARAMEIAGVNQLSIENMEDEIDGGEVIRDGLGNPTGIFNEKAMGLITKHVPETDEEIRLRALQLAVGACHRHGITGFHDAGADRETIALYKKAKAEGLLGVRMYVMIGGGRLAEERFPDGPVIDTTDHLLTIRAVKLSIDGALGSRGAWLLEDYSDRPGHAGHNTVPMEQVEVVAMKALEAGFQVCTHAIGDRANREVLDRYEAAFKALPEKSRDHRFRIEHAQHLHPEDIGRFAGLGVVPSMQTIHLSSDRPWAIDRLGEQRIVEGAYVWQKLLQSGARIVNGTDVPVEPLDPLACFYASVTRKTLQGTPTGGYEPDQKMTREQALRSYTLDAAYGAFEENIKGSIEAGKLADFTVFDKDIMTVAEEEILTTKVVMTIVGGKVVYRALE